MLVLSLMIFLPLLVGLRIPETDGPWAFLYLSHDTIYLWLKGNLYYRWFPESIIGLGMIATVTTAWGIFFLAGRSKSRGLHIHWIRRVILEPKLSRAMFPAISILRRAGLKQQLLFETTRHSRQMALYELAKSPVSGADPGLCEKLVRLTRFNARLCLLFRPGIEGRLSAMADTLDVFFMIRRYGDPSIPRYSRHLEMTGLILNELSQFLLKTPDTVRSMKPLFGSSAISKEFIAEDIIHLVHPYIKQGISSALNPRIATKPRAIQSRLITARLAESVDARKAILDQICIRLEKSAFQIRQTDVSKPDADSWPPFPGREDHLGAMGRLIFSIASYLAAIIGRDDIALDHIETFEALALVSELAMENGNNSTSDMASRAQKFVGILPRPMDYRVGADLAADRLSFLQSEWKQSPYTKDGIIRPDDFVPAMIGIDSLYNAARPDSPVPIKKNWNAR